MIKTPFLYDETDGPLVRLKDGSVLAAINGRPASGPPDVAGIFRSSDKGESWELLSTIKAAHDLVEVTVAELPDGRFVRARFSRIAGHLQYRWRTNVDCAGGGHLTEGAKRNMINCIRLRVRADHSGIDLLPAPNH